jgi:hypothetical protein
LEKIKDIEVKELEKITRENQEFGSSRTRKQEIRRIEESNTLEENIQKAYMIQTFIFNLIFHFLII